MKKIIMLTVILFSLPLHAEIPKRVITIGGSLTEIVYALDSQSLLVGSDTTSYYPEAAESLPKVGYQRTLSAEGILSLQPDLVILTEEAGPPAVLKQLKATGVDLISLKSSRSFNDVKNNITQIGEALHSIPQAQNLLKEIDQQYESLQNILESSRQSPQVLFLLQHAGGSPMVAGKDTAADSIIKLSGAKNVVKAFEGYKPFTPEAIIAMQPDVILVTAQGLEQVGSLDALLKIPGLAQTPAGQQKRVLVMDSLLLLGFGPRTPQAAIELHQMYSEI
jgi:iron complex transport system substrate-binding protein